MAACPSTLLFWKMRMDKATSMKKHEHERKRSSHPTGSTKTYAEKEEKADDLEIGFGGPVMQWSRCTGI